MQQKQKDPNKLYEECQNEIKKECTLQRGRNRSFERAMEQDEKEEERKKLLGHDIKSSKNSKV